MTPQLLSVLDLVRQLIAPRVLVIGTAALCATGAQDRGPSSAHVGRSDFDLLQEGVTVIPRAHVSVSKTGNQFLVHVLKGEVLLKRREPATYPVVVTAGSAQLKNIHAVLCLNVHEEHTDVNVLDGAVELSTLGDEPDLSGIPLHTGDRVELERVGHETQFHLSHTNADLAHCARPSWHLW